MTQSPSPTRARNSRKSYRTPLVIATAVVAVGALGAAAPAVAATVFADKPTHVEFISSAQVKTSIYAAESAISAANLVTQSTTASDLKLASDPIDLTSIKNAVADLSQHTTSQDILTPLRTLQLVQETAKVITQTDNVSTEAASQSQKIAAQKAAAEAAAAAKAQAEAEAAAQAEAEAQAAAEAEAEAAAEAEAEAQAAAESETQWNAGSSEDASSSGSQGEPTYTASSGGSPDDARATARTMALNNYGWGDDQFACLDSLWNKESGWNYQAYNPSGAYGIPQSLPGSKMASMGDDWETNPATQIAWGLSYISSVYGTPCGAWDHSQATDWY